MDIFEYIDRVKANFDKQPEPRYNTKKYFMGGLATPKRGLVDEPGSYSQKTGFAINPEGRLKGTKVAKEILDAKKVEKEQVEKATKKSKPISKPNLSSKFRR